MTLVEVLVVLAIIAMLVSFSVPALRGARDAARRAECLSRLRSQAIGVIAFMHAGQDLLPKCAGFIDLPAGDVGLAGPLAAHLDCELPSGANGTYLSPPPWRCPSDPGLHAVTGGSYEYVAGRIMTEWEALGTVEHPQRDVTKEFRDRNRGASILLDAPPAFAASRGVEGGVWHRRGGKAASSGDPSTRLGAFLDGHADWGSGGDW